jgi:integrase
MAYVRKTDAGYRAEVQRDGQRASKTFPTKREAQAWAMSAESNIKAIRTTSAKTFGNAADKYSREVAAKKKGKKWEDARLLVAVAHFGEHTQLARIDAPQISSWRDKRLETVSASTVVRESTLLKHLFHVARDEWRWMEHDPFRGVRMPKENDPRHQRWGWPLIKRVLRAPREGKTAEMQAAFHIALRTGMRLSEVLIAPQNFDRARRVVTLPDTKTGRREEVPIGRIAARLLDRPPFTVGANEGSTLFSKLCRQLLIEGLTFHDTRGSALTWLSKKVDVMMLARISRHRDLQILMDHYYRVTPGEIALRI